MKSEGNLVCKVLLPKKSPNAEPEIYRLSEFPANLAELQERVFQKCSSKLPIKYNFALEMQNGDLTTVVSGDHFAELIKTLKSENSQKTIKFHVISAPEKQDDSLEQLEKMLGEMKSFGAPAESGNKAFKGIEDISMTVSIIGAGPSYQNNGPSNLVPLEEKLNNISPAKDDNEWSHLKKEPMENQPALEENSMPVHDDKQIRIIDSESVPTDLQKDGIGLLEPEKQQEEEKAIPFVQDHQNKIVEEEGARVNPNEEKNSNGWNFTKEQADAIAQLLDKKAIEIERQVSAKYELICEQKIQHLNAQWAQRFELLEAAVAQLKADIAPQNKVVEEKKIDDLAPIKGNHKGIKILDLQPRDAILIQEPVISIKSSPQPLYEATFTLKNVGTESWPNNTVIECISGCHVGEFRLIGSKMPKEEHKMVLQFPHPSKPGAYQSTWRLYSSNTTEKEKKYFGPNVSFELKVEKPEKKKQKESKDIGN